MQHETNATNSPNASKRVLSIQSHVVHGYVGNKCAIFPLQLLGFDVDPIFSVQFSNHTGYPSLKGSVYNGDQLWELVEGLKSNDLLHYSHLLTGYIGSVTLLKTVARVLQELRKNNPDLIYVCDPVMGDNGRLYVAPEVIPAFRTEIVPLASVLTPNQFEAEQLTGLEIRTESEALAACEALHKMGPSTVVITSMECPDSSTDLLLIASSTLPQAEGSPARLRLRIPKLDAYFTGTGDLLSALLLARLHEHPERLGLAVARAVAGLQGVLQATAAAAGDAVRVSERSAGAMKARELRLIQNQALLVDPVVQLHPEPLS